MFTIEVRNRIVGASPDQPQLSTVALDLLTETLTVAELIAMTVEEQVRDLLINRKLDAAIAQRALARQYLTDAETQAQAAHGAIRYPKAKPVAIPHIDVDKEIQHAMENFERETFLIYVDGQPAVALDETLTLRPNSKVTFLRLTPLVGG